MIFDNIFEFFLNSGGHIFGALASPIFTGGSRHQTGHPEFLFEMIIGMILIQKMPSGASSLATPSRSSSGPTPR